MGMKVNGSTGLTFPDSTTMVTGNQAVKAWVNFNGTGTVAIRASYNVTSITDNGTGAYTVNFTTAMPDLNYSTVGSSWYNGVTSSLFAIIAPPTSTSSKAISTQNAGSSAAVDVDHCCVAFFR